MINKLGHAPSARSTNRTATFLSLTLTSANRRPSRQKHLDPPLERTPESLSMASGSVSETKTSFSLNKWTAQTAFKPCVFPTTVFSGLNFSLWRGCHPLNSCENPRLRSILVFLPLFFLFFALTLVVFEILKPPHPVKVSVNSNTTVIRSNWLGATC